MADQHENNYIPLTGRLSKHFGYKSTTDGSSNNSGKVFCFHCGKSFAFHGSYTTLSYHLRKIHGLNYDDARSTTHGSLTSSKSTSSHSCHLPNQPAKLHRNITVAIANWIASSGRPIALVEDEGLQDLLRTALQNSEYKLPRRPTIDKMLNDLYDTKLSNVKDLVKKSKSITLTSDFWTSTKESYCEITGHWITDDWELLNVVFECVHVTQRQYSNNELYKDFAKKWDITQKMNTIVTQNTRNRFSNPGQAGYSCIPCFAHRLQLSILHGLNISDTEPLFAKCRKIIGHFKHLHLNKIELQGDSPIGKLQQDIPTRWNSIFLMLQSLLNARESITEYLSDRMNQGPKFLDSDWDKISNYAKILDLFNQATVILGKDIYVPCSCVLPLLASLVKHVDVNDDDPEYIVKFKTFFISDFNGRVSDMTENEILRISAALDPRFKNLKFLSDIEKNQTWSLIEREISNYDLGRNETSEPNSIYLSMRDSTKRLKLIESETESDDGVEYSDELEKYKMEKRSGDSMDPLQWWKSNECRYPKLSIYAKTILCTPATSVPCEQLFSSDGYVVNKMRSSIEAGDVNMLVCLRNWTRNKF